jgi:MFS family permease
LLITVALASAAVEGLRTLSPASVTEGLHIDVSHSGLLIAAYSTGSLAGLLAFGAVHSRIGGFLMLVCAFVASAVGAVIVGVAGARRTAPRRSTRRSDQAGLPVVRDLA